MKNSKTLKAWLNSFNLSHPLVIAGPCSAETEAQVLKTANDLKNSKATILRAGIWKPRTRPGNFEGVGAIGLKWLQKAKKETGMLIATEVANKDHVKLALNHDIDVLWIGARTTVNPFMVQEIAEALEQTDKIVLVKNPINPDLSLWLGAIERLHSKNIKKLGVIHRGFSAYEKTKYRNNPEWQIPIELQNLFPDLPLILDPSHIAGRRDVIFDLCQTALDLNYDGIMVETHFDPDNAWSDKEQQITPKTLIKIISELKTRKVTDDEENFKNALSSLRTKIDVIDNQIIEIIGKRMKISNKIGELKKEQNVAILQSKRWADTLQRMITEGKQNKLSQEFILKIFKAIHQESINHQKNIVNH